MTKEEFIHAMELLRGQSSRDNALSKELLAALKRAFPETYDWLLWWLDAPEDFHVQTERNAQGWDLKDAAALYDFLVSPAARDGTLWGCEAVMLSLVISRELREKLDDFVFGTGINFQEFLLTALHWLLAHPGEVKRMLHTDTFWERCDYRGDFSDIRGYDPICRDAFKRNVDEILDSAYRGVIPHRIRNTDGSMAMLLPCGAEV